MLEPIATAVTRAVELARQRGAVVMLDPNIRPALIEDRAAYLARLDGVLAQTDVLKLSVDDVAWLEPGEPPRAAARELLDRGPRIVLLTAGADGATVFTPRTTTLDPSVACRRRRHDRRRRRLQRRLPGCAGCASASRCWTLARQSCLPLLTSAADGAVDHVAVVDAARSPRDVASVPARSAGYAAGA